MSRTSENTGRPPRLQVDGLLLLNKPAGMTSNQALQRVKRLLKARKAGHTGSLDPAATGMLPLCFGEATKVCAYLLDADKSYRVTARLGQQTTTGDADGEVCAQAPVPSLAPAEWQAILNGFLGDSEQVPPMYSALKRDGKRLYELARQGQTVEREPRKIHISRLDLLEAHGKRLVMRVRCSKGTYIRSLVEDIAAAAGTVAFTASLHRESVGSFHADAMIDMRTAEAEAGEAGPGSLADRLLPVDRALEDFPAVTVGSVDGKRFCEGQAVAASLEERAGHLRVYGQDGTFLGIGSPTAAGEVAPRRIFRIAENSAKKP